MFKQITGYRGGEDGRVFSYKTNKYLKLRIDRGGYVNVKLYLNGKGINYLVHRLIAEQLIPNPENKKTVNHKNGIKTDNRLENLEWATYSENLIHKYKVLGYVGTNKGQIGQNSANSKKVQQLNSEGNIIKIWDCMKEAADLLKLNAAHITSCCKGKRKTTGGFKWKYIIG